MRSLFQTWQQGALAALLIAVALLGACVAVMVPLVAVELVRDLAGFSPWHVERWLLPLAVLWVPLGLGYAVPYLRRLQQSKVEAK